MEQGMGNNNTSSCILSACSEATMTTVRRTRGWTILEGGNTNVFFIRSQTKDESKRLEVPVGHMMEGRDGEE
jgi:hypothetical protein